MATSSKKLLVEKAARVKDLVLVGILMLIGGYAFLSIAATSGTGFIAGQKMDHATLPSIWGVVLVLLACLWGTQVALDLRRINNEIRAKGLDGEITTPSRLFPDLSLTLVVRIFTTIAAMMAYGSLLETAPFVLATGVFLFIMLLTFGRTINIATILLAVGGGAVFHLLFVTFLKLPL